MLGNQLMKLSASNFTGLLALCLVFACGRKHDDTPATYDLAALEKQRDAMVSAFDETMIDRCDRLTFVGLMQAFGKDVIIHRYEYPAGVWHRDVTPCYPPDSNPVP